MHSMGLVSISFRSYAPEEILAEMKRARLSCIEWGSDVHAPCNEPEKLKQLAALQTQYGIHCCSYGTYFKLGVTPLKELECYIAAAKILGTDILRLWCGKSGSADYTSKETEELFDMARQAAQIAKKHGVCLCMECHGGTYTDTAASALALMQAVNSPHFQMYWQPNYLDNEEQKIAYAKQLEGYIKHVHVFHWNKEGKRLPLAEGMLLWQKYLQVLRGSHNLLLEFMPDDQLSTLENEAAALRKVIGDV